MDFFHSGIPVGTYRGIEVRLHFTFLLFAFYRAASFGHIGFGIAFVAGLYGCILLHEFGHALAARWCDGECDLIVLWPLGGLAFARPAFHPTAHLITTVAGPLVTLGLWLMFAGLERLMEMAFAQAGGSVWYAHWFVATMANWNRWLLIFNLIPAFPMDGGRMLRDVIWHWMSAERATGIAVGLSQLIAVAGIVYALFAGEHWLILLAAFILLQSSSEKAVVGAEALGAYQFSLRDRLRRGSRRRQFQRAVAVRQREAESAAFHRCAVCGLTDRDDAAMEFRVCPECSGGQEYCRAHLDAHTHV